MTIVHHVLSYLILFPPCKNPAASTEDKELSSLLTGKWVKGLPLPPSSVTRDEAGFTPESFEPQNPPLAPHSEVAASVGRRPR